MKFIKLDEEKCDSCYKCLRTCPTKAIAFQGHKKIIDEKCIKCGRCQTSCEKDVINIVTPFEEVKKQINSDRQVIVSLAPSYIGSFDMKHPNQIATGLRKLNFDVIEETAIGAEIVSKRYESIIESHKMENIITTCCPSASLLIESHFPNLIEHMLPIVSPMIAHGRFIKSRYKDAFVVFIGPCFAKIAEAEEVSEGVDAVITFKELSEWFEEEGIILSELDESTFDLYGSKRGKIFPVNLNLNYDSKEKQYRYIRVSGIDECTNILSEISNDKIKDCCVEINICDGSCMNGPEMPQNGLGQYERELRLKNYVESHNENKNYIEITGNEVNVERKFTDKRVIDKKPEGKELAKIMMLMGKYSILDETNCGACGFETCKDKATAIYNDRAKSDDCLIYLRNKAESINETLIKNSPNGLCTIGEDLNIKTYNPKFYEIFNRDDISMFDLPIDYFVEKRLFENVFINKKNIIDKKIFVPENNKYLYVNIIYNEVQNLAISFFTDITSNEKKREELEQVKKETLLKTQEVIDNQMRVAQEIAGLLGETTAETKMSLKSLKELVMSEE